MNVILVTVLFLLWVNFLPPLFGQIFGDRLSLPVDRGLNWMDGRPLLGPHKTARGVAAALTGSLLFIPILGLPWFVILIAAILVVTGDLLTSFIKRRLGHESGDTMAVLDQFLECALPCLYLRLHLDITPVGLALVIILFIPFSYLGSLSWQYLTYRPPIKNRLRIIRSTARLRAWRACHQPLVRWQTLLNFEHFLYYRIFMTIMLKMTGLYEKGAANALNIVKAEETFSFHDLPPSFDGFTILFLSDLHLDGMTQLTDEIIDIVDGMEVDLCLLGGDYRMEVYGSFTPAMRCLRRLMPHIHSKHGVLGVLGNHDCIEMLPDLEDAGVVMLVNDFWYIEEGGEKIWIVGIDDPHYYKVHDLESAYSNVPPDGWTLFLAHSPEVYREAMRFQPRLYLCGHTHGGQICLPNNKPIFTHCRAPRSTSSGRWKHQGMTGYTSRGVGPSGVPVRFHCPGEITLITLVRTQVATDDGNC